MSLLRRKSNKTVTSQKTRHSGRLSGVVDVSIVPAGWTRCRQPPISITVRRSWSGSGRFPNASMTRLPAPFARRSGRRRGPGGARRHWYGPGRGNPGHRHRRRDPAVRELRSRRAGAAGPLPVNHRLVPGRPAVAEEPAALDQRGDIWRDHGLPRVVARGYPAEHVAAEDRQEFRPVVVEVDETASPGEVVKQRLQLGTDGDVVHGRELVVRRGPQGVNIELQVVLE